MIASTPRGVSEGGASGVTAARGFRAGGIACGIKTIAGTPDLALLIADSPCAVAGVFTRNRAAAAPVLLCRARVSTGRARAVVVNSGNANACTGPQGMRDAEAMAARTAERFALAPAEVLVLSTGVIGVPMPMDRVEDGIARCEVEHDGGERFARAILTTDTCLKARTITYEHEGTTITIGGAAKGSGMIHPNMATMLAVITTDAPVAPGFLQDVLRRAADRTFNLISVDGDSSTNDSLIALASGAAGGGAIDAAHPGAAAFERALTAVCADLAKDVVRDGEGANSVIEIQVRGAGSDAEARAVARAITVSPLVKAAVFGGDPNWGRVICAAGNAGPDFDVSRASLTLEGIELFRGGMGVPFDRTAAAARLKQAEVHLVLDLGGGDGQAVAWGCDLSYDYVRINAEYTT